MYLVSERMIMLKMFLKIVILIAMFSMSYVKMIIFVTVSQKCTTPFGKSSKCVPLHECPDLLYASRQNPLSQHMLSFLQKSKCGLGSTSKVCCGPFPDEKPNSVVNIMIFFQYIVFSLKLPGD